MNCKMKQNFYIPNSQDCLNNFKFRKTFSYYAVFDGHAGERAAEFCAENMHKYLAEKISKAIQLKSSLELMEKEIKRIFVETFKQCDEEFLKMAAKK